MNRVSGTLIVVTLLARAPALVAQHPPVPLVVRQVDVTVDSVTLHDIRHSPLIAEQFAAVDTSGPVLAMLGKFNLLRIAAVSRHRPGVVLAVENASGWDRLVGLLHLTAVSPGALPGASPWYADPAFTHVATLLPDSDGTSFDIAGLTADASRTMGMRDSLDGDNRTMARLLAPYFDPTRLLSHLTGATLALSPDDADRIIAALSRDSVAISRDGAGTVITLDRFTLHLVPPWSGIGVRQLQFALTREVSTNPTYRFGPRSRLKFGPGAVAVWDFN